MNTTIETFFDVIHAAAPADEPGDERDDLPRVGDAADDAVAHAVLTAGSFVPYST